MRRALSIYLAFQRQTGHAHPHLVAVLRNYVALLRAMGRSEAELDTALEGLWRD